MSMIVSVTLIASPFLCFCLFVVCRERCDDDDDVEDEDDEDVDADHGDERTMMTMLINMTTTIC